jgi:hypothetical protein
MLPMRLELLSYLHNDCIHCDRSKGIFVQLLTYEAHNEVHTLLNDDQGCTVRRTGMYRTYQIRRIYKMKSIVRDKYFMHS